MSGSYREESVLRSNEVPWRRLIFINNGIQLVKVTHRFPNGSCGINAWEWPNIKEAVELMPVDGMMIIRIDALFQQLVEAADEEAWLTQQNVREVVIHGAFDKEGGTTNQIIIPTGRQLGGRVHVLSWDYFLSFPYGSTDYLDTKSALSATLVNLAGFTDENIYRDFLSRLADGRACDFDEVLFMKVPSDTLPGTTFSPELISYATISRR